MDSPPPFSYPPEHLLPSLLPTGLALRSGPCFFGTGLGFSVAPPRGTGNRQQFIKNAQVKINVKTLKRGSKNKTKK
jgi:hypothetical protein